MSYSYCLLTIRCMYVLVAVFDRTSDCCAAVMVVAFGVRITVVI